MRRNRFLELQGVYSAAQSTDLCRVSSGNAGSAFLPRVDCVFKSADTGTVTAAASLSFDSDVMSIAAGWVLSDTGGFRRLVVVCRLRDRGRSRPAIMHFCPAKR